MKIKNLIKELKKLNKPNADITLLANIGHPEDETKDVNFDTIEVWDDGEDSITLFFGLKNKK